MAKFAKVHQWSSRRDLDLMEQVRLVGVGAFRGEKLQVDTIRK